MMGSSDPSNVTYPSGTITINPATREITGSNPERQDFIIGPNRAEGFSGYFVARFDAPFVAFGTVQNGTVRAGDSARDGTMLGGYAVFPRDTHTVDVRIGVSFISVEQARRNLDKEIPDGTTLEQTARTTRAAWAEKLDRVQIQGGSREQLETFYTALFHTLQVCVFRFAVALGASLNPRSSIPMNKTRTASTTRDTMTRFMKASHILATRSGYIFPTHRWLYLTLHTQDTFRAVWGWQILFAPERIPGMVQSMLQDYKEVLSLRIPIANIDAERCYREDGSPCGRILSVSNVCIHLRSHLSPGRRNEHHGRHPRGLINCGSCPEGDHWIRHRTGI